MNDCTEKAGFRETFDTALNIEDRSTLLSYLRRTGIIQPRDAPKVRVLPGGVSNRTVLVTCASTPPFVVKQALAKLRVAVDWYSDPERIHREARGLEWLYELAPPGTITRLRFEDREHHVIGMDAVPEPHQNWKTMLLAGDLQMDHVEQFARILGVVHRKSSERRSQLLEVFEDRSFFETLRLEPYYRYSALQVNEAKPFLESLIYDTLETKIALVHGDYSPKNVLVHDGKLVLLDHEVIHFGDPAFDVGFSLTHFLSKAHHLRTQREQFLNAASAYARVYLDSVSGLDWSVEAESRAVRHTVACLLARTVGRSPLEYLTPEEIDHQRAIALTLTTRAPCHLSELILAFSELQCR